MQQKKINISVRDLVDFSVGGKSIEKVNISILSEAAWEGTACHTRFQKEMANQHKENFEKEVILSDIIENEDVRLTVSGRVDGIVKDDESIWIYEIKTLQKEMEHVEGDNESHWGQAQCYAYIYATKNQKKSIGIKLVYIHRESKEQKIFSQQYEINELKKAYEKFVFKYLNWMTKIRKWEIFRNNSIQTLTFPFQSY